MPKLTAKLKSAAGTRAFRNTLRLGVAVAIIGIFAAPAMHVEEAKADQFCQTSPYLTCTPITDPNDPFYGFSECMDSSGNGNGVACGPEMADYLAILMVVLAAGAVFIIRRRALPVAA